jgi:hypothetical protein
MGIIEGTNISRDVSRHITTLSLNDGQGSEGATSELIAHLRGTLEQTRVEVEDITRVGLTTGRTTEQEGHLTVSHSLFRQVIIDDEGCTKTVRAV